MDIGGLHFVFHTTLTNSHWQIKILHSTPKRHEHISDNVSPPIPTHISAAWSVCLSVCRLSHSCTLLKWFNRLKCHFADTLVKSNDTLC